MSPLCSGVPQRNSSVFSVPRFCCEILEFGTGVGIAADYRSFAFGSSRCRADHFRAQSMKPPTVNAIRNHIGGLLVGYGFVSFFCFGILEELWANAAPRQPN